MRISSAVLRLELERILQSRVFERAQRSQRFLTYLVNAALANPPLSVKEYALALDVFDRDTTYNPNVDATVRVEASRLRSRLRDYYAGEGRHASWTIQIPRGGYNIVTMPRSVDSQTAAPAEIDLPYTTVATALPPASSPAQRHPLRTLCLALILLLAGAAAGWFYRHLEPQEPAVTKPVSLAILPFANHTGDPRLNALADTLNGNLIRQLSQLTALRVIGRSIMFHYRDHTADAQTIAAALHVNTIMTAELRRAPQHLSLTVEVTSASDGSVILDHDYKLSREYTWHPNPQADGLALDAALADVRRDLLARLTM